MLSRVVSPNFETEKHFCYLYTVLTLDNQFMKIGISSDPYARVRNLQSACPLAVRLVLSKMYPSVEYAKKAESEVHRALCTLRVTGGKNEWFRFHNRAYEILVHHLRTCHRVWGEELYRAISPITGGVQYAEHKRWTGSRHEDDMELI